MTKYKTILLLIVSCTIVLAFVYIGSGYSRIYTNFNALYKINISGKLISKWSRTVEIAYIDGSLDEDAKLVLVDVVNEYSHLIKNNINITYFDNTIKMGSADCFSCIGSKKYDVIIYQDRTKSSMSRAMQATDFFNKSYINAYPSFENIFTKEHIIRTRDTNPCLVIPVIKYDSESEYVSNIIDSQYVVFSRYIVDSRRLCLVEELGHALLFFGDDIANNADNTIFNIKEKDEEWVELTYNDLKMIEFIYSDYVNNGDKIDELLWPFIKFSIDDYFTNLIPRF